MIIRLKLWHVNSWRREVKHARAPVKHFHARNICFTSHRSPAASPSRPHHWCSAARAGRDPPRKKAREKKTQRSKSTCADLKKRKYNLIRIQMNVSQVDDSEPLAWSVWNANFLSLNVKFDLEQQLAHVSARENDCPDYAAIMCDRRALLACIKKLSLTSKIWP